MSHEFGTTTFASDHGVTADAREFVPGEVVRVRGGPNMIVIGPIMKPARVPMATGETYELTALVECGWYAKDDSWQSARIPIAALVKA